MLSCLLVENHFFIRTNCIWRRRPRSRRHCCCCFYNAVIKRQWENKRIYREETPFNSYNFIIVEIVIVFAYATHFHSHKNCSQQTDSTVITVIYQMFYTEYCSVDRKTTNTYTNNFHGMTLNGASQWVSIHNFENCNNDNFWQRAHSFWLHLSCLLLLAAEIIHCKTFGIAMKMFAKTKKKIL